MLNVNLPCAPLGWVIVPLKLFGTEGVPGDPQVQGS
jgi:hypothetical protein